jgi:hypothetical protein
MLPPVADGALNAYGAEIEPFWRNSMGIGFLVVGSGSGRITAFDLRRRRR